MSVKIINDVINDLMPTNRDCILAIDQIRQTLVISVTSLEIWDERVEIIPLPETKTRKCEQNVKDYSGQLLYNDAERPGF